MGIANRQACCIGCVMPFIHQTRKPFHGTKTAQISSESLRALPLEGAPALKWEVKVAHVKSPPITVSVRFLLLPRNCENVKEWCSLKKWTCIFYYPQGLKFPQLSPKLLWLLQSFPVHLFGVLVLVLWQEMQMCRWLTLRGAVYTIVNAKVLRQQQRHQWK